MDMIRQLHNYMKTWEPVVDELKTKAQVNPEIMPYYTQIKAELDKRKAQLYKLTGVVAEVTPQLHTKTDDIHVTSEMNVGECDVIKGNKAA